MLTGIELRNFGAVGAETLRITTSRITVLVGANGSGKSSVLRALSVLGQTAERHDRLGLVHDGDRVTFEDPSDMWFGRETSAHLRLGVDLGFPDLEMVRLADHREHRARVVWPKWTEISYACEVWQGRFSTRVSQEVRALKQRAVAGSRPGAHGGETQFLEIGGETHESAIAGPDHILDPNAFLPQKGGSDGTLTSSMEVVRTFLATRVQPIATTRSESVLSREAKARSTTNTGPRGAFTLPYILEQGTRDTKRRDTLVKWFELLGLNSFRVTFEASRYAGMFDDTVTRKTLPLYLAGHGHQQSLELLAELAFAPAGTVITVEEPENSLHPAAQTALADIIVEAARDHGLQIVLSTQSPSFALSFCRAVRVHALSKDDLSLVELSRDRKTGTVGRRLEVDESGLAHPAWFASFARAEADLLREFASPPEPKNGTSAKTAKPQPARRRR